MAEIVDMKRAGTVAYTDEKGREFRYCLCGCDQVVLSPKARFVPGHDARFVRLVRRELKREIKLNKLQKAYAEERGLYEYVQVRLDREKAVEKAKMERKIARDKARELKRKEKEAAKLARAEENKTKSEEQVKELVTA